MTLNKPSKHAATGLFVLLLGVLSAPSVKAKDVFLTIGGGSAPSSNQVSLEKNVLLLNRTLRDLDVRYFSSDIFFSDGGRRDKDVKVIDPQSIPQANRLMAEFFGDEEHLGLRYRDHQIPNVRGATSPKNIRKWFSTVGAGLQSGDTLFIYVTAHGQRGEGRAEHNTTIAMWDNQSLKMTEFVKLLDSLQPKVDVVVVMVQCYSGGFARLMFTDGDPKQGLSPQRRVGFFASVHDKPASGCTAEVDAAGYTEYSTYFWSAFTGIDRTGQKVDRPDYNADGTVSFDEAHAYTLIASDTIDIPMKTSGEFLSVHGDFGKEDPQLLSDDEPFPVILRMATPSQKAVLVELSKQLDLTSDDRVATALRETKNRRSRGRGRTNSREITRLRSRIAADLKTRWPELDNVLNPLATELLTRRKQEFVDAIETHPDYKRYRELKRAALPTSTSEKRRAKFNRLIRTADNVVFAENLRRTDAEKYAQYLSIVDGESLSFSRRSK